MFTLQEPSAAGTWVENVEQLQFADFQFVITKHSLVQTSTTAPPSELREQQDGSAKEESSTKEDNEIKEHNDQGIYLQHACCCIIAMTTIWLHDLIHAAQFVRVSVEDVFVCEHCSRPLIYWQGFCQIIQLLMKHIPASSVCSTATLLLLLFSIFWDEDHKNSFVWENMRVYQGLSYITTLFCLKILLFRSFPALVTDC